MRIIYATHRDLSVFREDLRCRIAAHTFYLKPLREHRDEIVPLARLFLSEFNRKSGRVIKADDKTLKLLELSEWQGNVRELRSFVELITLSALFARGESPSTETIELTDEILLWRLSISTARGQKGASFVMMSDKILPFVPGEKLGEHLEKIETYLLKTALDTHKNNQTRRQTFGMAPVR